jgi:succinyl-CoA synthetase beta subunit
VWIEGASEIASEYYASVVFDRSAKAPLVMLSTKGGMDIEAVADEDPGRDRAAARRPAARLPGLPRKPAGVRGRRRRDVVRPVGAMLAKLYDTFVAEEATLVEVNPLIVTPERTSRRSTRRSRSTTTRSSATPTTPSCATSPARTAGADGQERGLTYVKLDGNIGILGNGAGLVMSTLDVVALAGGEPANFLDAGGGSKAEAITSAVEVILSDPKVKAVLFNIFGGITRCDEVAKGLIEAFAQIKPTGAVRGAPGRHQRRGGPALLAEANLPNVYTESTMDGAAAKVVELAAANMSILVDETRGCARPASPAARARSTRCATVTTAPRSSPASPPARAARTSTASRSSTPSTRPSTQGANTAMIFVPPRFAADSILEAEDAGIELIIAITEGIPAHDELRAYSVIKKNGRARLIGPNCPGILSPGKANVGIIPAAFFKPGNVGVVSRSGTLTYQIGNELAQSGFGNSTIVGIGGDPVPGTDFIDVIGLFQDDPETELIVMCGEIGGDAEERAAEFIAST